MLTVCSLRVRQSPEWRGLLSHSLSAALSNGSGSRGRSRHGDPLGQIYAQQREREREREGEERRRR